MNLTGVIIGFLVGLLALALAIKPLFVYLKISQPTKIERDYRNYLISLFMAGLTILGFCIYQVVLEFLF